MAGIAPQQSNPEELGDDVETNVSDDENEAFNDFMAAAFALIYENEDDKPRASVLKLLDDDPSDLKAILTAEELDQFTPLVAIAATAVVLVVHLLDVAGEERPDDAVIMHGGASVVEELATIWEGVNKTEISEDDTNKAWTMAADLFREVAADKGLIDEAALKDEFNKLVVADHEGRLGEVSPELEGINRLAEKNMEEGDEPEASDNPQEEQQEPVQ